MASRYPLGMRLPSGFVLFALVGTAGCSFDFGSFGNSGAGGSTSGAGQSTAAGQGPSAANGVTSSNGVTSATVGSSTSGTSSSTTTASNAASSSASSGAGGARPMPLAACGAVTDDFANFPSSTWQFQGTASSPGGAAKLQIGPGEFWSAAWLATSGLDDCATTIDLGTQPSIGDVFLNIYQDTLVNVKIGYVAGTKVLSYPVGVKVLAATPQSLGFAISNGKIYFLARISNAWTVAGSANRPSWLDDNESIGFGISNSSSGKNATFDNFNLTPVYPSDLP